MGVSNTMFLAVFVVLMASSSKCDNTAPDTLPSQKKQLRLYAAAQ
jgi:hypothetical protein